MNAVNPDDFFDVIAAQLDRFELVPDDVLWELVTRDGACMLRYRLDLEPEWTGDALTDRQLAARICADCPVRSECLELQLRTCGGQPLGVWGALHAEDLRAVFPVWRSQRRRRGGGLGDQHDDQVADLSGGGGDGGQR
jgi:WhiB family transcriptional regulator, redox-sensing transcriptional regulator